jgi:nucleotide-binding universal stress UspA family protein
VRTIIAPVTLAQEALEAVAVAAWLTVALEGELVLAGIAPLVRADPIPSPRYLDVLSRHTRQQELVDRLITERLDQLAAHLPPGPRLRKLLVHGPVGATLLRAAREHAADLVVIPMRREHERARIADHHSDGYVLRHSDVPVVVVPISPDSPGGRP